MSMVTEIKKHLAHDMEDLHTLFIHDIETMDIVYYNEVYLALAEAENKILKAEAVYLAKLAAVAKQVKHI